MSSVLLAGSIKVGIAIVMVVILSLLSETVSPRFAGIVSGYPLGAAISLFFIGYEISPAFAAQSALHTSVGLVATQVFAYCYYRTSLSTRRRDRLARTVTSSLGGTFGYFLAALLLSLLRIDRILAIFLPSLSIVLFMHLFRNVENVSIQKRVSTNGKVLLLRSAFAACSVVLITSTARMVGPGWAGLFAAFPITMLPFVVIIHYTYDTEHVHAILKNAPRGLGSLVVYSLAVSVFYPTHGIYIGTAISYALATIYLIAAQLDLSQFRKSQRTERA